MSFGTFLPTFGLPRGSDGTRRVPRFARPLLYLALLSTALSAPVQVVASDFGAGVKLAASDGASFDLFGGSVAITGNVALVGALNDDDNGGGSGSAYVFEFNGAAWIETAKLIASDGDDGDEFGASVALSGSTALIGAMRDETDGSSSGSAYIFDSTGSSWSETTKLTPSDAGGAFGASVAIEGSVAVVGAPWSDGSSTRQGAAYVFSFNGSTWEETSKLTASDGAFDDSFGEAVALSGQTIVVGAPRDDDGGGESGSAYIFEFDGGSWIEVAKLTASDAAASDLFGWSVAADGAVAVVGAISNQPDGAAYVFRNNGLSEWIEEAAVAPGGSVGADFGVSVDVQSDTMAVGARFDIVNGVLTGAVYTFLFDGTAWVEDQQIVSTDAEEFDDFGIAVALEGDRLLVGAHGDDDGGFETGAAYALGRPGPTTHFEFDSVQAQVAEVPFPVVLTAKSALGLTTDFDGQVSLGATHGTVTPSFVEFEDGAVTTAVAVDAPASDMQLLATGAGATGSSAPFEVTGPITSGKLGGRVVGLDGLPVQGAAVEVSTVGHATLTDADGVFAFDGVPCASATIQAEAPGGQVTPEVELPGGGCTIARQALDLLLVVPDADCQSRGVEPVLLVPGIMGSSVNSLFFDFFPELPTFEPTASHWPPWTDDGRPGGLFDLFGIVGWRDLAVALAVADERYRARTQRCPSATQTAPQSTARSFRCRGIGGCLPTRLPSDISNQPSRGRKLQVQLQARSGLWRTAWEDWSFAPTCRGPRWPTRTMCRGSRWWALQT